MTTFASGRGAVATGPRWGEALLASCLVAVAASGCVRDRAGAAPPEAVPVEAGAPQAGGSTAPPTSSAPPQPAAAGVRAAVLFIGDGMGPAYVTVARVARHGSAGRLRLDELPYTAITRTYSADSPVTDSAAAASAMACGAKTNNGVLCQDASGAYGRRDGRPLESIAVRAHAAGFRVGIVTTARVTHATPAAFYVTVNDREQERTIARRAIEAPLDLLLGGGRRFFRPQPGQGTPRAGAARDAGDLETLARQRGWRLLFTAADLRVVDPAADPGTPILGLFDASHLPYEAAPPDSARTGSAPATAARVAAAPRSAPTLEQMTRFALDRLQAAGAPFLLVVEGGRIDHAGHENWARTLVDEMAAFDAAIGAAIDRLDPRISLVLVTADHETGGLALNGYPDEAAGIWGRYHMEGEGDWPVLTFSTGPGLTGAAAQAPWGEDDRRAAGVGAPSAAHTGVDVPLYAWGKGAEQVHGTLENTAVYWFLRAFVDGTGPPRF